MEKNKTLVQSQGEIEGWNDREERSERWEDREAGGDEQPGSHLTPVDGQHHLVTHFLNCPARLATKHTPAAAPSRHEHRPRRRTAQITVQHLPAPPPYTFELLMAAPCSTANSKLRKSATMT